MTRSLLVGLDDPDDAAVYQLDEKTAIVFTADYFPPVVDEPHAYGSIAAANALSDVYAMGGRPVLALNLATFPDDMPLEISREILRGSAAKALEAGAVVAGGHTTHGDEPMFGLAVIGLVSPSELMRKGGARVGDRLFLTKPLGTGVITTAGKRAKASPGALQAAIASMSALNRVASEAARAAGARCGTDVTGFGLIGHALEMARASQVRFRIDVSRVPLLPGAADCGRGGHFPGGAVTNEAFFAASAHVNGNVGTLVRRLLFSPETAGGLLLALPASSIQPFCTACAAAGHSVWEIGTVTEGEGIELTGTPE